MGDQVRPASGGLMAKWMCEGGAAGIGLAKAGRMVRNAAGTWNADRVIARIEPVQREPTRATSSPMEGDGKISTVWP